MQIVPLLNAKVNAFTIDYYEILHTRCQRPEVEEATG